MLEEQGVPRGLLRLSRERCAFAKTGSVCLILYLFTQKLQDREARELFGFVFFTCLGRLFCLFVLAAGYIENGMTVESMAFKV